MDSCWRASIILVRKSARSECVANRLVPSQICSQVKGLAIEIEDLPLDQVHGVLLMLTVLCHQLLDEW